MAFTYDTRCDDELSSLFADAGTAFSAATGRHILGQVSYGSGPAGIVADGAGVTLRVQMTRSPERAFHEIWETTNPVVTGHRAGLHYAHDGDFLFCVGHIPPDDRYTAATRHAYSEALLLAAEQGYPEIFRTWNFVSGINASNVDGLENYRDFCWGRALAFDLHRRRTDLPAATAVGSLGGGICFYFLAARTANRINIENPRQVSAFRYPRQYGPKPPSFARATCLVPQTPGSTGRRSIFVSGTASILGHRTVHPGDVRKQCAETFENMAQLVAAPNLHRHGISGGHDLRDFTNLKVYVRHEEDIDVVRNLCADAFGPAVDIVFLNVDICRPDLLVEIEGMITSPDDFC